MDDIRLIPCRSCGGQPVVMIRPAWPSNTVTVICSNCGKKTPGIIFDPKGARPWLGVDRYLLPDLATARRQAAAAWNEGIDANA